VLDLGGLAGKIKILMM